MLEKINMNIQLINETIASVCHEIAHSSERKLHWLEMGEVDYIREAAICICSSQMRYEVAEAAGNRIAKMDSLKQKDFYSSINTLHELENVFAEPLEMEINGKTRIGYPRFRNRTISYLIRTFQAFSSKNLSFRSILRGATTPKDARVALTRNVIGFGPKQASLFLRRIGFSCELAILDTHVLDYLKIVRGIAPKLSMLSSILGYEKIEHEFVNIASEFNHMVGDVDLAVWVTMRVAKREMVLWGL
jgi:N-glycosylase/DNA lyase